MWFIPTAFYSDVLKTQTYTTQIQVFHVTDFGFVSRPSSDLFCLSKAGRWKPLLAYKIEITLLYSICHKIGSCLLHVGNYDPWFCVFMQCCYLHFVLHAYWKCLQMAVDKKKVWWWLVNKAKTGNLEHFLLLLLLYLCCVRLGFLI
jgi:hypothetical protein